MKKIFRIKKYKFETAPDDVCLSINFDGKITKSRGNGKHCVAIFQSNTLGLTWKHLVTYLASYNKESFLKSQIELIKDAKEEVKKLYKTENCNHKNTHKETVCHPGGEVGTGLICDYCEKLLKYN